MGRHPYDPLDPASGNTAATRAERDRTVRIGRDCRPVLTRAYGMDD